MFNNTKLSDIQVMCCGFPNIQTEIETTTTHIAIKINKNGDSRIRKNISENVIIYCKTCGHIFKK